MKEQIAFCETIASDLARLFPGYHSSWFTSNVATSKPGQLLTISMPSEVARQLIDVFMESGRASTSELG
jgi:hypothetical protein